MKTKQIIIPLIVLSLALCASASRADTITATGGGNWHSTTPNAPWPGGIVPSASDDAIITPAVNVDSTVSIHGLTINGGGTFYIGNSINASGDFALGGTATVQGAGGVAITIGGSLSIGSGTSFDVSG